MVASGSLPRGVGSEYYATVCRLVHQAGGRFALDASGEPFRAGLAAEPEAIKPNLDELEEAVGHPVGTFGDAIAAAQELLERGARSAAVSLGPDGALLVHPGQVWHAWARASTPEAPSGRAMRYWPVSSPAGEAVSERCVKPSHGVPPQWNARKSRAQGHRATPGERPAQRSTSADENAPPRHGGRGRMSRRASGLL
ncbi:MAG: PfkB family carbohydrate kinase [Jatrophihabitantaceae bacterium]